MGKKINNIDTVKREITDWGRFCTSNHRKDLLSLIQEGLLEFDTGKEKKHTTKKHEQSVHRNRNME